ncbi:MAG: SCP2 sterol-binding domain-containing protein [Candidatus Helarchaeota archaeon]
MGYYDIIASRMMLNTLLFAISELSKVNERILFMNKNQNMVIKVSIGDGGPTEYLEIKNDLIYFQKDKKLPSFDAEIHFNNPLEFLKLLKQTKIDLTKLEKEGKVKLSGFENFKRNCEEIINIALPYYNNALPEENISPEDEALQVKIILFALMAGFQEITEEDENVQEEIKGVNVLIHVEVENGPQCYLNFKNGAFSGCMEDPGEKPTVTLKLSDLKTARALMTGKGDAAKAFIKGKIQIAGDTKHAMKLMNLSELLSDYYDYVKMKQKKL